MGEPITISLTVFTYKDPSRHLLPSLMQFRSSEEVRLVHYGQSGDADPVTERNLALWTAYEHPEQPEVAVFVDHDQSFSPGTIETLVTLAAEVKGVVGGMISLKRIGAGFAAKAYEGDTQEFNPGEPGLLRLKSIGSGMMAIHRSVVDRLIKGAERIWYGGNELPPLFDNVYVRDGARVTRLGEDVSFCLRCREADIPIYGAQEPDVVHWGEYGFTWRDAIKGKGKQDRPKISRIDVLETQDPAKRFNVVTIRPPGYVHSDSFREMSTLLHASFVELGYNAIESENRFCEDRRNIVLGANLLASPPPTPYVVYQLEQLADREGWAFGGRGERLLEVLREAEEVWDYAPENIAWLKEHGIEAKHLPIGYHKALETIEHAEDKDIDVLFYGSKNERRVTLIEQIEERGLHVVARWADCYGAERDALIARAKVVLCCHFYAAQVMEQLRISHLLNNRALVVAEASKVDPYGDAIVSASYERLPAIVARWAEQTLETRNGAASASYRWFRQYLMTAHLEEVLS